MEEVQYHLLAEVEDRHWWHRILRQAVAEALAKHGSDHLDILDLGCGTGGLLASLAARHQVFGVDLSSLALVYSRARGLKRLAAGSVEALPLADSSFDAVISIDVLSHRSLHSDVDAAREIHRILRPGGILILQLSAFDWLHGEHDRSVHQLRRYTRTQVVRMLEQAGFSLLNSRYRLAFLPPLMVVNNLWAKLRRAPDRPDIALPSPAVNRLLHTAGWVDLRLGALSPIGSSVFCVARR